MILSIHQPHFFPWLGYFHKIIQSDIFVVLDNVQFRKNYFQNRTQIKGSNGESYWFSVQVQNAPLNTLINEIKIAPVYKPQKNIETLKGFYRKAPFFNELSPVIFKILNGNFDSLSSINMAGLRSILEILQIEIPIIVASELDLINQDANKRLIEICKKFNTDTYLAGRGGRKYMDMDLFLSENIDVKWQQFEPSNYTYHQINGEFLPGLSVLDVLFNIGPEETNKLLSNDEYIA